MNLRRRRTASEPTAVAFSYCENVHASALSPSHIRKVGPEGQKFGGGVPGAALCGKDLAKGWDLKSPITEQSLTRGLSIPAGTPGRDCAACVQEYRRLTGGTDR